MAKFTRPYIGERAAMSPVKILFVYKYCTLGGVERIILNRAKLYKSANIPVKLFVAFLYENQESITAFDDFISSESLTENIAICKYSSVNEKDFDFIVPIDTPEVFHNFKKDLIVECHSTYHESIKYLTKLNGQIKKILVPSLPFKNFLLRHFDLSAEKIVVLQNFVLKPAKPKYVKNKTWNKAIVFYFGRLDAHKNVSDLINTFLHCKRIKKDLLFLVLSPNIYDYRDFLLKNNDLIDSLIIKSGLWFAETTNFLYTMLQHQGIYLSASNNESFGLSTAESLSVGIPSVVRDIPVHRYLCQDYQPFLYGNKEGAKEAAEKICQITEDYESYAHKAAELSAHVTCSMQKEHINQLKNSFDL